ncbi:MAG: peptidoglycan DD-metalloendopeptidase family protein [Rivularia sp. T60_A2020_040]|nr:peptidoglycan DD-metalloendopeptidase family protein [Rivularia sp. T60_A2020_040]
MKRALKKKMKTVLESTINSSDASMEHSSVVTPQVKNRMPKAAMIGLAISMGATSLFVTRQSDQALAAEPVGNQNTASTIPAASDEVKFAPTHKQSFKAISNEIGAKIPAVVEPTAISPVKGLGAKWEVASSLKSARFATQTPSLNLTAAKNNTNYSAPQVVEAQVIPEASTTTLSSVSNHSFRNSTQSLDASGAVTTSKTELEAQQKFALERLKQKSNRLKASLNQLRSTPVEDVKQVAVTTQSAIQVEETSTVNPELSASQNKLVSKLKPQTVIEQAQPAVTVPTPVVPTLTAPKVIAAAHLVKSGDTLAKIADNYGTSVEKLAKTNHLSDPNQLQIDQQLIVPAAETPSLQIATNSENITSSTQEVSTQIDSSEQNVSSFGVGGDTPIPTVFTEMQLADRRNAIANKISRDDRLRSLKEEIERLREKYRTQESGVVVPQTDQNTNSVSVPVNRPQSAFIPIPITTPTTGKAAVPIRVARPNTTSVPISVPTPNQDINPNFSRDRGIRVATPPASFNDRSQSSSVVQTTVSPQLPPLAAVDRYLPKPIDESIAPEKGYIWPAKGVFTSGFGPRWGRMHKGIDIAAPTGTPINAAADGVVESAGWNRGGYGNLVDIRHADGTLTRYAHNSKVLVSKGQQVEQGQRISLMGSTGFSTGPHLHFEIRKGGTQAVNPIAFLPPRK